MTRHAPCAIDFGTSNSAVALPAAGATPVKRVALEDGLTGLPTAVFTAVAPQARSARGDRFASVATGLGVFARRMFEGAPA